ncbi:Gfo/Idh/MocA family protein [Anaerobium acetethylicum]|uniref:Predicted dehydrogenase n=1 Tax=Anaerobium acetethylicum TaxID=1619234 RepID=A0A1D3TW95_9FIRM|nr:Gfo/Idh/MocA family oxidoreductase [Anaerobium acetethylicum]SCP98452.1 Predicted dehydrogenase [Anaerobium acetethylicum]
MKNGKLQIGIVGCGGIANNKHMPSLKKLADKCEMVAFCDTIEERAVKAAGEYGTEDAKVYTDYLEMYKDETIDIIHVLTPNVVHCPATVAAFEAGKHVLCEKPMAHTSEDARKMMDAWKKSGKKFTIGYQNRFREEIQSLHTACENDELGDIYYAKAHAVRRRAVPTWGVFPNKALQGGGPLIDIGTHALDITLWMMDNYKPVSVTGSVFYKLGSLAQATEGNMFGPWDPETYEVEDSAFGMIKMENGAAIYLEAAWALNVSESKEASTTLCGTKAGAEVLSGMSYPIDQLVYNRGHHGVLTEEKISKAGNIAYFEGGTGEPGYMEAKQWLDAILNDTDALVKPEQAFVVTQILEAIYESNRTGKEVFLSR